jgi:ribosome-binding factor A
VVPNRDQRRPARVAGRIQQELMDLVLRGELRDAALTDLVITGVKVTDDLRHARIFVRLLRPEPDPVGQSAVVAALQRATGFLRRELGSHLGLRYTPELTFSWDGTVDQALRIESILDEVRRDEE